MTDYLSVEQFLRLHASQLRHYGGGTGLSDRSGLEAAASRPAMTFGGEDLYADVPAKAAALMRSLALNHPFVDGNKRVAAHAAVLFALINGYSCVATSDELVAITLDVAKGEVEVEALVIWFRQRLRQIA